jgi:hypothetical protein
MRLEDLTIALRPRQPWEAIDLGCTLVRRDYGRILAVWGITVVPLWLILAVLLRNHPAVFPWVAWWLKPLYDRVPLYFISRAAFGVRPSLKECLAAWPRLWSRFLISALLFRRLSFIRSFALPIRMLEGQRGKAVRERVKALASDSGSSGFMASYVFLKLELAVYLGLWTLASFVTPEGGVPDFSEFFMGLFDTSSLMETQSPAENWYLHGLYLLAITLVEPFYVGAGFGLYLNSRIKLEGWDIELTFRKLAARLAPAAAVVLAVLLTLAPAYATPEPGAAKQAAQAEAAETPAEDPAAASAKKILSQPEFKVHKTTRKVPVVNEPGDAPDIGWVATLLKALGWTAAAGVVALIVWWIIRNRHLFKVSRPQARVQSGAIRPKVIMGLDIARESLPVDLLAAARAAWQAGRLREALSLLYRGALSRLVEQRRLPIRDSDTEDDCLVHVARSGERTITDYFRRLTMVWVRAAYAGVEATPDEFHDLCHGWPFDAAPARPRAATAVAPLLVLTLCLLSTSCKFRDEEVVIGYKGKARSDPFLAAQYLLKEYDHDAAKLTVLKKLPEEPLDKVLVLSGENGISEGRARQLLQWVDDGGHLIYALAGCRPYSDWNIFGIISNVAPRTGKEQKDPLLLALDVELSDRSIDLKEKLNEPVKEAAESKKDKAENDAGVDKADAAEETKAKAKSKQEKAETNDKTDPPNAKDLAAALEDAGMRSYELQWNSRTYDLELSQLVTFKLTRKLRTGEFAAGPVDAAAALGLRRGLGRITLINHARPFRNRYLADHDHAGLLLDLVGDDPAEVQFVLSLEGSFWGMLWQKAWMAILALALLVLLWLWRNLPRFGPVRHVELHETKHFLEHITALGHFFHALKRNDILLTAAADAVRARALRRFPHLHAGGEAALNALLMERSGLPEDRVHAAMSPPVSQQPHHLVRMLHDLQKLRQSLA